ncbi:uncharacterized protein [Nicotiana tomentosiformis]|uniref:uncharacterized protein n=1 Tax=Nicotiana tomentosiformis TaxID=4098 RepID=UPI00388CB7D6
MAGTTVSLSSSMHTENWIVDSGATYHMASTLNLLSDVKNVDNSGNNKVRLPNGDSTYITHIGSAGLTGDTKLKNMLYVPNIKFNLMPVSKLTRDLCCTAIFLPELYIFQDLYNGRVKEIGRSMMAYHVVHDKCTVYPLAKHPRLSFPNSESRSTKSFQLVHMDSETIVILKQFLCMVKTQSDIAIKKCRRSILALSALRVPHTFKEAAKDPKWIEAMKHEIFALEENKTWEVVDSPPGKNAIRSKWVYEIKYKVNSEIERFKARLLAKGYNQQEGLDYNETFSPIAKLVTVRSVIKLAASND